MPTFSQPRGTRPQSSRGKIVLKVKADAVAPALTGKPLVFSSIKPASLPAQVAQPLRYLRTNAGLSKMSAPFSARRIGLRRFQAADATEQTVNLLSSVVDSDSESLSGISVAQLDPATDTDEALAALRGSDAFEFAERLPVRWLSARQGARPEPFRNLQWGLRAIRFFEAEATPGRAVAVLDTGVDDEHPELSSLTEHHHRGLRSEDLIGHGTHVAGILAADVNNAVGISGAARCEIKAWKIFEDEPDPSGQFYVDAERYFAALHETRTADVGVVNLSIGGTSHSQVEAMLFRRLEEEGILAVAAMGNEYHEGNPTEYPAAYDGVLAVGSIDETMQRSSFSNTGKHIDLVAPGSNILSTLPSYASRIANRRETNYAAWSGTSMATPYVAAAASLVMSKFASLDPAGVKRQLVETCTRLRGMGGAWTEGYGHGLLNLEASLASLVE